jgi:hypothetical protein
MWSHSIDFPNIFIFILKGKKLDGKPKKKGQTLTTINTGEYMSQDHYIQGKLKTRKTFNKPRWKIEGDK